MIGASSPVGQDRDDAGVLRGLVTSEAARAMYWSVFASFGEIAGTKNTGSVCCGCRPGRVGEMGATILADPGCALSEMDIGVISWIGGTEGRVKRDTEFVFCLTGT
eukprot:CAMPEP_0184675304 /NCGR_PEP_ID=MMETSP0308-20130426/87717_1 /TAXON_ID=38269 /ORGANISM="Gloeochaete witrockiana, Strain SAG 46.84" /LENGTH=105 /DNA_ID=CAMNT_0027122999 /DNA_START=1109 /DNA_END=1426 /DNA_ORIENTATION=-